MSGLELATPATRPADFMWAGRPGHRCRFCGDRFERVGNLDAVLRHEAEAHAPQVRQSPILGQDGQPLLVQEGR